MSFRKQQIESTLKKAVSQILARGLSDPRVTGLVSVTRFEVSDDIRNANIYVSVLPDTHEKTTLAGLNSAAPFIFTQVCKAVALKTVPHLHFKLDEKAKKQAAVLEAIRQGIRREGDGAAEGSTGESERQEQMP